MILSLAERYVLLDILPREGTYTTLKIVHGLRQSLSFSEEEIKDNELKEVQLPNGQFQIQGKLDTAVDVAIGEKATDIVVDILKKMNKNAELPEKERTGRPLTEREFWLYDKFVNGVTKGD